MKIKSGFVAVLGRPNAGKSSLINAMVGQKVSIVSPKPQTTRNNILGILNGEDFQIIFVDTPGINKKGSGLDDFMQKSIKGAVDDVNAVILCQDIQKDLTKTEFDLIENFNKKNIPIILAFTKIDLVEEKKVFEVLQKYSYLAEKCELVPVSSYKNKNLETILDLIKKFLPQIEEKNRYFDDDLFTDKSINFILAEVVREKLLYNLKDEVPHDVAVLTEEFDEQENIVNVSVLIVCAKEGQKAIILGKNGENLKKIGHDARVAMQKFLQKKVNLTLFVKVKTNWKNNLEFLDTLGYNING